MHLLNLFAHQAAMALAGGQGMPLGSLYLQSDTGLGKSHLSQATKRPGDLRQVSQFLG